MGHSPHQVPIKISVHIDRDTAHRDVDSDIGGYCLGISTLDRAAAKQSRSLTPSFVLTCVCTVIMALLAAPFFGAIFFRGLNANTKATLLVAVIAGTFVCLCFVSVSRSVFVCPLGCISPPSIGPNLLCLPFFYALCVNRCAAECAVQGHQVRALRPHHTDGIHPPRRRVQGMLPINT